MFEVGQTYSRKGNSGYKIKVLYSSERNVLAEVVSTSFEIGINVGGELLLPLHSFDGWKLYKEPVVIVQECFINAKKDGHPEGRMDFWTSANSGEGNYYKCLGKVLITYTEGAGFTLENLHMDDDTI